MKKMMLTLSLSFAFLISGCKPEEKMELAVSEVTIEYGDVLSLNAEDYLVDGTDKEILDNVIVDVGIVNDEGKTEGPIDTDGSDLKVGSYQLSLRYNIEIKLLTVTVQDTTPPEFINFTEKVTFAQGESTDLSQLFKIEDKSPVEVTVEGDVDFNVIGEYKVKIIAKDEYDNTTEKECNIQITAKEVAVETPNTSGGSGSSNSSSGSSNSSTNSGSNNSSNTGGSSNAGSSSGSSNTGSSGSGGSTTTPPSQPEPTPEPHEHKFIVNSTTTYYEGNELLFDNWDDALAKGDEVQYYAFNHSVEEAIEKYGNWTNLTVKGVRCANGCGELWYVVELTY